MVNYMINIIMVFSEMNHILLYVHDAVPRVSDYVVIISKHFFSHFLFNFVYRHSPLKLFDAITAKVLCKGIIIK